MPAVRIFSSRKLGLRPYVSYVLCSNLHSTLKLTHVKQAVRN